MLRSPPLKQPLLGRHHPALPPTCPIPQSTSCPAHWRCRQSSLRRNTGSPSPAPTTSSSSHVRQAGREEGSVICLPTLTSNAQLPMQRLTPPPSLHPLLPSCASPSACRPHQHSVGVGCAAGGGQRAAALPGAAAGGVRLAPGPCGQALPWLQAAGCAARGRGLSSGGGECGAGAARAGAAGRPGDVKLRFEKLLAPLSGAAAATSAAAPAAACSAVPAAVGAPLVTSESTPAHPPAPLLPPCGRRPCRLPLSSCPAYPATTAASAARQDVQAVGAHIRHSVVGRLADAGGAGGSGGGAVRKQPKLTNVPASPAFGSIAVVCSRCL